MPKMRLILKHFAELLLDTLVLFLGFIHTHTSFIFGEFYILIFI